MIEALISAGIAALAGAATLTTRIHSRISEVDRRIDAIELRIAERYVSREELSTSLKRFEDHMVRIENKLDAIVMKSTPHG
jgi:septal ring factor EnvC (AmiA/AmiB activator)